MIAQHLVDRIRSETNIVDIISEFVTLKQKGHEYTAPCPFLDHVDDSPSFSVSQPKQIYKCFGCGRGGNVFTFLMDYQHMSFVEAVDFCARRRGIKLEFAGNKDRFELLAEIHEKASQAFAAGISSDDRYFIRERGLTAATVKKFRLGYDNGGFKNSKIVAQYPSDIVFDSGLLAKTKDKKIIDRWSGRYVFPFIDLQGKVIGFAGTNAKAVPKYINSPETELYKKSSYLYGLYQARDAIKKTNGVIVTEGYFDCLSLVQAGFANTVAVCGSALTAQHGKLLARFCSEAVLFFDGDPGGARATDAAVSSLFENNITVYVAQCPAGTDPDELISEHGRQGVLSVFWDIQNWFDYRLQYENSAEKMEKINLVKEIASEIESADRRSLFLDLCAEQLGIQREGLLVKRVVNPRRSDVPKLVSTKPVEIALLAALHLYPEFTAEKLNRNIFTDESLAQLYDIIISAKGETASLYNNISTEQTHLLNIILDLSIKELDAQALLSNVLYISVNRRIKTVIETIAQRECQGMDCADLAEKFKHLMVEREEYCK